MRKKLLFLVSVFVVALFTISMAQGPEKTTEPKAATSAGKAGAPIARRAPMRKTAGKNVRRTPNAIAGLRVIAGLPVIAAAEGRPAERTMP